MKPAIVIVVSLVAIVSGALSYHLRSQQSSSGPHAHVESSFEFTVRAPYARVAPLFGAHGERAWAEGWDPHFIYPQPASDIQGEVFTVSHGHLSAIWVNTVLDLNAGHVQYVYVLPGAQATAIDIQLRADNPSATHVRVVYSRTALDPAFNAHLQSHGQDTAREWQEAIEKSLGVPQT